MKKIIEVIRSNLANQVLLICFLTVIIPLIILLGMLYSKEKESVISSKLSSLETLYHVKLQDIEMITQNELTRAEGIAMMPQVQKNFERIGSNNFKVDSDTDQYANSLAKMRMVYDIFFIDLDGNIKYTVKKECDLGTNLIHGEYKHTGLASAFANAKLLIQSIIVPIEQYAPSNKPAGFVATPVLSNNRLVGILAVQIDEDNFFDAVKSNVGIGQTGEIVAGLLRQDGKVVSAVPLKYAPKAFEEQLVLNKNNAAIGIVKASMGMKGSGEFIDYRGVACLGVYGYVPSLRWGLVVKIDKKEVMSEVGQRLNFMIGIIVSTLILLTLSIIYITRHITKPIIELTSKTDEIINGNFGLKLEVDRKDEIGKLSTSFNTMSDEVRIQIEALSEQARLLEEQAQEIEEHSEILEETVKMRTAQLDESRQKLERYVSVINEHVITSTTDLHGIIIGVSNAFCKISGYTKDELIGKSHNIVRHPDMPSSLYKEIWARLERNQPWSGEIKNMKKTGSDYWVHTNIEPLHNTDGDKIGYTAVRQDITDKKIIEKLSITDELTQLYNRRYFNQIFAKKFNDSLDPNGFAFLMLDVDNFKKYNDTYGHQKGDTVLVFIGKTIGNFAKPNEQAFRLGGEEFGVIIECKNASEAINRADNLRQLIKDGQILHEKNPAGVVTVSVGVRFIAKGNRDVSMLDATYRECDEALYRAKENGRDRVELS